MRKWSGLRAAAEEQMLAQICDFKGAAAVSGVQGGLIQSNSTSEFLQDWLGEGGTETMLPLHHRGLSVSSPAKKKSLLHPQTGSQILNLGQNCLKSQGLQ